MQNELYHPIKIGNLTIRGNLFLAPMAGFTDSAFRYICKSLGANFTYTEMVSCEALYRNNEKTIHLMKKAENEDKFAIQIFASNEESVKKSVNNILKASPSLIDLNCGCPVPKIVKSGSGSALMKTPETIGKIVNVLIKETNLPITVKIRSGWDSASINYLEAGLIAQDNGASAVAIHSRTKKQAYSGNANWDHIKELKKKLSIPVIGSGDLFLPEDTKNMILQTNCDGVMFARGAIGNPFIFEQSKKLLISGIAPKPITPQDKVKTAFIHLRNCIEEKGEKIGCKEMKKHLCAYTKGIHGSAKFRNNIVHSESLKEYEDIFNQFLASLTSPSSE